MLRRAAMVCSRDRRWSLVLTCLPLLLALGACEDNKTEATSGQADVTRQDTGETDDESSDEKGGGEAETTQSDTGTSNEARPRINSDRKGTITEEPPLEIESYMTASQMGDLGSGSYEPAELPGRKASPDYNSRRLKPAGGSGYGAGLQVWAFGEKKAMQSKFEELKSQYLNVTEPPEATDGFSNDRTFVSERGGIANFVFSLDEPRRIVAVSCSSRTCRSTDDLLTLVRRVRKKIEQQGDAGDDRGEEAKE